MAFEVYDDYEQGERVQKWLRQNGLSIVVGVAIGLVGIFGWQQWNNHKAGRESQASQLYQQVQSAIAGGKNDQAETLTEQLFKDYADSPYYRFNDDGEPGGTAGRPILQAIEGQGIDRAVVVVTRWYGGIKLGAGGLARAYGGTAAECLRLAERVAIVAMARLGLQCEFAELALLKARLKECEAQIEEERFGAAGVELVLRLPESRVAEAQARIVDITRGRAAARRLD